VVAGLPVALAVFDLLADYLGGAGRGRVRDDGGYFGPRWGTLYPTSLAAGPRGAGPQATVTALVADGTRVVPGDAVLRLSGDAVVLLGGGADDTQLRHPPVGDRLRHQGMGRCPGRHRGRGQGHAHRRCPACGRLRSTRCGAAAARTTAWHSATPRSSRTTTSRRRAVVATAVRAVRAAARPRAGDRGRVRLRRPGPRGARGWGARFILLDNMPVPTLREAVAAARAYDGVRLEASGGLRLANAREVAVHRRRLPVGRRPDPTPRARSTWASTTAARPSSTAATSAAGRSSSRPSSTSATSVCRQVFVPGSSTSHESRRKPAPRRSAEMSAAAETRRRPSFGSWPGSKRPWGIVMHHVAEHVARGVEQGARRSPTAPRDRWPREYVVVDGRVRGVFADVSAPGALACPRACARPPATAATTTATPPPRLAHRADRDAHRPLAPGGGPGPDVAHAPVPGRAPRPRGTAVRRGQTRAILTWSARDV